MIPYYHDSRLLPVTSTGAHISAYDITSGVHTNAHEDAFSAPRTNVRLVAVFGAFKVPRVHSCALHLHYPLAIGMLQQESKHAEFAFAAASPLHQHHESHGQTST